MAAYLMGIDLGTSSVKALVTDERGRVQGLGQCEYRVKTPRPGFAEQDPEEWYRGTGLAVRQAIEHSGVRPEQILAIGLSGQMHGMVALDEAGKPVRDSVIHLDQRSFREKEEILRKAGPLVGEELKNHPGTGMLLCSLLWMKRHCPEEYEKTCRVLAPKDFIRYRLTGEMASDYCDASASYAFDLKNRRWCRRLLKELELREDLWCQVYPSHAVAGRVSAEAAGELGVAAGTKVVVGTGDCAAQLLGNGIIREGLVSCNIGTSSQIAAVVSTAVMDERQRCQLWCHAVPEAYVFQGGAINGGNTLSWFRNQVLQREIPFYVLDKSAGEVPPGCSGLFFLPYLAGERTPWNNPKARGAFLGLGLHHDQGFMIRAVMEGVVYNLRLCMESFDEKGIRQDRLVASGGGARGRTWRQIQADMFHMPVYTTEVEEQACLGAAILASVGAGLYGCVLDACQEMVRFREEVTEPIRENVSYYEERRDVFRRLYEQVEMTYELL